MGARRLVFFALLVSASLESGARGEPRAAVAAAPKLGDSLTGRAKEDYELGRVLYQNLDYAGALVKFQSAFDLSSDYRLLWNMAACEKNLRHYAQVLPLVERFLRDGAARITPAERGEAETVLRTVRPLLGELHVFVNEAGASVFVDDSLAGTAPFAEPVLVDLGDRRVRVSKPGFKDQSFVRHLTGGAQVTLTVTMEREVHEGRVLITTDAAGAIELDGKPMALGRWQGTVIPGTHALRIVAPGMQTYTTDLVVSDGESRTLDVTLRKQTSHVSPLWWVGAGVVAAAGLGVGGYFLFHQTTAAPTDGTLPFTIVVQK